VDPVRDGIQIPPSAGLPLKISAHAMQRLQSRNITLSSDDLDRMNQMADKAAAKGSKQSLFMMGDTAMVVSIKNRVVITAVDSDSMKDNVFTNIDSAAIIK
jgi:flagellar operon protein